MQEHFSPRLIKRCQKIFSARSGLPVGPEQAEMILEKLARLGEIAVHVLKSEIKARRGGEKV